MDEVTLTCPLCGGKLVRQTAREGTPGPWQCENYPDCKWNVEETVDTQYKPMHKRQTKKPN
jgi:ssDNA-binding Zn-finger/Zn-ribbon topoisomerase 1